MAGEGINLAQSPQAAPAVVRGTGSATRYLTEPEIREIVRQGLSSLSLDGRRLLVIIPDGTRTMPMPLMFDAIEMEADSRVAALDYLVALNKLVFQYDQILICGPVFPHEVVGFSGGNKYLFPGIAGPDIINLTHWLGALLTNYDVIGAGYTPVRAGTPTRAAFKNWDRIPDSIRSAIGSRRMLWAPISTGLTGKTHCRKRSSTA